MGYGSALNDEESRLRAIDLSLAKAASLIEEGYLTAPEQENAVAYLREVQQLDPGNEVAHILLARCAEQLAAVAQEAYTYGLTDAATQYLDLALTHYSGSGPLGRVAQQLGDRHRLDVVAGSLFG